MQLRYLQSVASVEWTITQQHGTKTSNISSRASNYPDIAEICPISLQYQGNSTPWSSPWHQGAPLEKHQIATIRSHLVFLKGAPLEKHHMATIRSHLVFLQGAPLEKHQMAIIRSHVVFLKGAPLEKHHMATIRSHFVKPPGHQMKRWF